MSWITEITFEKATGALKQLYKRIKGPNDYLDNILTVHSLRPHSLLGHMTLYKNVLHHRENSLPKWYLETVGVYVSLLNQCTYCVEHHAAGLKRLLKNDRFYETLRLALEAGAFNAIDLDERYKEGLSYAKLLSQTPADVREKDIQALRHAGFSDGEILELNQVISYFHYANRTVLGLGVSLQGDILGLSPNDNEDSSNWSHS